MAERPAQVFTADERLAVHDQDALRAIARSGEPDTRGVTGPPLPRLHRRTHAAAEGLREVLLHLLAPVPDVTMTSPQPAVERRLHHEVDDWESAYAMQHLGPSHSSCGYRAPRQARWLSS